MSDPEPLRAVPGKTMPVPATLAGVLPLGSAGLDLRLRVTDPDCVTELSRRPEGREREDLALAALRIGVLALRQAGGHLDVQSLRSEGARLVDGVEASLKAHALAIETCLSRELETYFDPSKGHLPERLRELTDDKGRLAMLLRQHLDGEQSVLARQLARSVGDGSELMRRLDPKQQDGIIETIARIAEERLHAQGRKVLDEFDLNRPESALSRLIRSVGDINREIGEKFDPADEKSVLSRLGKALEQTREQVRRELSLDETDSSLSRLRGELSRQLAAQHEKQEQFQAHVGELIGKALGIRQERSVSTSGGFDFEQLATEKLKSRAHALGDAFEHVGDTHGDLKRKTGDQLQVLGSESAAPGGRIVYECKRDATYRLSSARAELDEARRNRGAEVGVFVMSAATLRENAKLAAEYPRSLARYDRDIVVVWDADDASTDVCLDAAMSLARALVLRGRADAGTRSAADWTAIDGATAELSKQLEHFAEMTTWCEGIRGNADKISERLRKTRRQVEQHLERLDDQLARLRA